MRIRFIWCDSDTQISGELRWGLWYSDEWGVRVLPNINWLVVWLVGGLTGWWFDWLMVWLVDGLTSWWFDWLVVWLVDSLTGWWFDWLVVWLVDGLTGWWFDWLMVWLVDGLTGWWFDWLMAWLVDGLTGFWFGWLVVWLVDGLTGCWFDWLMAWLVGGLEWLVGGLEWLVGGLTGCWFSLAGCMHFFTLSGRLPFTVSHLVSFAALKVWPPHEPHNASIDDKQFVPLQAWERFRFHMMGSAWSMNHSAIVNNQYKQSRPHSIG